MELWEFRCYGLCWWILRAGILAPLLLIFIMVNRWEIRLLVHVYDTLPWNSSITNPVRERQCVECDSWKHWSIHWILDAIQAFINVIIYKQSQKWQQGLYGERVKLNWDFQYMVWLLIWGKNIHEWRWAARYLTVSSETTHQSTVAFATQHLRWFRSFRPLRQKQYRRPI